ncbi:UNVERIFIED_CONTAM: hypothetical protein RMT77_018372 [Armadillidium vulgare]
MDPLEIDNEEINLIQDQDPILRRLKRAILRNLPFVGVLRPFARSHKYLYLRDDRLYKEMITGDFSLIVPEEYLTTIAIKAHWSFAHVGKQKLYSLLIQRIWHPKINTICADITSSCFKCQAYKISNIIYAPPILKIATSRPFELVAMDLIQFPKTARGNHYALVMVDHFTKWVSAVPLRNKQSATVTDLVKHQILPFLPRLPERLLTDNGREFIGPEFEEFLRNQSIKHVLTTPYTPASNGAVEGVNRTLSQYLRMSVTRLNYWDEDLSQVVLIYNHTVHSETQMTPCENILKRAHTLSTGLPLPRVDECWEEGHHQFESYEVDQLVGLKVHLPGDLTLNKFRPRYYGPYKVIQIQSNGVTYVIESEKDGRQCRVHHKQLRKWKVPPEYLRNSPVFQKYALEGEDDIQPIEIEEEPIEEKLNKEMEVVLPEIEEEDEESFFEGFVVDQEKLKQIKDKLVIIAQQHAALVTEFRSTSKVMHGPDEKETVCEDTYEEVITDEEREVNSFLQWDTSDLLEEAERRWELTEAMILPSPIVEPDIIEHDLNNLRRNQFSTPVISEERNVEEGVLEEEVGERFRIDEFSFSGFDKGNRPNVPLLIKLSQEDRPYTCSRGVCLDLPLVHPYLLERKRRK